MFTARSRVHRRPKRLAGVGSAFAAMVLAAATLTACGPAPATTPPSAPPATDTPSVSAPAVPSLPAVTTDSAVTTVAPVPGTVPVGAQPPPQAGPDCGPDDYRNVDGVCVHRPESAAAPPAGATARCGDGTYSFSQHRRGTCSGHGGVAEWLA